MQYFKGAGKIIINEKSYWLLKSNQTFGQLINKKLALKVLSGTVLEIIKLQNLKAMEKGDQSYTNIERNSWGS